MIESEEDSRPVRRSAARAGVRGAYLHGAGRRACADGAARGRPRTLGGDVRLARDRTADRCDRRSAGPTAADRGSAAELVGRDARSGRGFHDLRLRAGLCHRRERAPGAASRAVPRHCRRRLRCALFRRPAHEDRGQSLSRISNLVERRCVLLVPAAAAALARKRGHRAPGRCDLPADPRHASGQGRAVSLRSTSPWCWWDALSQPSRWSAISRCRPRSRSRCA